MSAALRYRIAGNQAQLTLGGSVLIVDPAGPLVEYSDYARLKEKSACQAEALNAFDKKLREAEAEVERLEIENKHLQNTLNRYALEDVRWQAKVERIQKAGDDMLHYWSSGTGTDLENFIKAVWLWTTAKQPPTNLKSSAD